MNAAVWPRPGWSLIACGAGFLSSAMAGLATGRCADPGLPQYEWASCLLGLVLVVWGWSRLRKAKVDRPGPPPRGVVGAMAVLAALFVVGVCLVETPGAVASTCANCRLGCRADVYRGGACGVGAAALAALVARFAGPTDFRVARSAALVALVFWLAAVGFVRGWW